MYIGKGTPSSGKSTVVTHLRLLHEEDNYTTFDRAEACKQIVMYILRVLHQVCLRTTVMPVSRPEYVRLYPEVYKILLQASFEIEVQASFKIQISQSMVRELQELWAIPWVRDKVEVLSPSLIPQSVSDNIP